MVNVIFLQPVHGWMASPVYLSAHCHCVLSQMQDLTKEPQVLNWANPDNHDHDQNSTRPRAQCQGQRANMGAVRLEIRAKKKAKTADESKKTSTVGGDQLPVLFVPFILLSTTTRHPLQRHPPPRCVWKPVVDTFLLIVRSSRQSSLRRS
jgi:hypothetical protein